MTTNELLQYIERQAVEHARKVQSLEDEIYVLKMDLKDYKVEGAKELNKSRARIRELEGHLSGRMETHLQETASTGDESLDRALAEAF